VSPETTNSVIAGVAVAAVVILALAALLAAIAMWRVARDVRRVRRSLEPAIGALNDELPATLKELRQTAANLERVSDELGPRLLRVDVLLDESEATVQSLRATVETAEDIVRGPAAAMDRAKRAGSAAGRALGRGADRIRKGVGDRRVRAAADSDGEENLGG
jgi:hypothetical protein